MREKRNRHVIRYGSLLSSHCSLPSPRASQKWARTDEIHDRPHLLRGRPELNEQEKESFKALARLYGEKYDFYFLHLKKTDSTGEDGDFEKKVKVIEEIDKYLPTITGLKPDVLVVTGDHSTASVIAFHSWHPVPVCMHSRFARADEARASDEVSCLPGALGIRPGLHLMGLALADARKLKKLGA